MKRILTAIVLIAFVIGLVFFGKLWMITVLCALVAGLAAYEFRELAAAGGSPIPLWWTLGAVALFFLATFYRPQDTITSVSLAMLVLFTWNTFRTSLSRVLSETAAGLLVLLYIAYPLTLLPRMLGEEENGTALLLFLFLCVWFGDIAALYVGKNFGRRKLSSLSPNKTWEGSIASAAGSVVFGMTLYYLGVYLAPRGYTALHIAIPAWQMVILAIILNLAGQLGDLLESAIKRGAGVKDSGTMLPGHGGILDRIDALLLAAPVLWYILLLKDWQTLFR